MGRRGALCPPTTYGRRKGHRLRPARRRLLETLLPRIAVPLPGPGGRALDLRSAFGRPVGGVWLEIGFGAGEHLAAQAKAHPEVGFVGCETFENGIASLLRHIAGQGLGNVRIFADDARLLLPCLAEASVDRAFVLFPDPWPKKRHHKRRLIAGPTLDDLARVLADGAELGLATDDAAYVRHMLLCLARHEAFCWMARCAADWRTRPADWPPTRYERKALDQGRRPVYLRFRRRPRVPNPARRSGGAGESA